MSAIDDLGAIQKALDAATQAYAGASDRSRVANIDETNARNKLNQAQADLDAAVATLRKAAPRSTRWADAKVLREESR